ncbi:MAG: hypothetical protein TH68_01880, partial [Candidatus Synechococcus spongiarum 142]
VTAGRMSKEIVFNIWRKGMVAEQKAGSLVRMAEGQGVTCKITKRLNEMFPVRRLAEMIRDILSERSED